MAENSDFTSIFVWGTLPSCICVAISNFTLFPLAQNSESHIAKISVSAGALMRIS